VLAQLIATEIANSGLFAVLPRTSMIQTVMREHQIQRSNLTEETNIKRIGQALNAQYVLAGNIRKVGQTNMFTAQILNVENASLIVGDFENYNAIGDGISKMRSLGKKLTGVYNIGDIGPAGGIIAGEIKSSNGLRRYLEAAPSSEEFEADFSEALSKCSDLNIGGFSNWKAPDEDELDLMYKNLKRKGLGGFGNGRYWASSRPEIAYSGRSDSYVVASAQDFSNGQKNSLRTSSKNLVRPVRYISVLTF